MHAKTASKGFYVTENSYNRHGFLIKGIYSGGADFYDEVSKRHLKVLLS